MTLLFFYYKIIIKKTQICGYVKEIILRSGRHIIYHKKGLEKLYESVEFHGDFDEGN